MINKFTNIYSNIMGDYGTVSPWTGRQTQGESPVNIPASVGRDHETGGPQKTLAQQSKRNQTDVLKEGTTNTYPCCPGVHVIADYMGNWGQFGGVFPSVFSRPAAVKWCCLHDCWKCARFVMNRCERVCFRVTSPPCGTTRKTKIVGFRMNIKYSYVFFPQRIFYSRLWRLKLCCDFNK